MSVTLKGDYDTMTFNNNDAATVPEPPYTENPVASSCCCHNHHAAPNSTQIVHHYTHPESRANVIPLPLLQRTPALVECPGCRQVAPTIVTHVNGKGTHWMATFFFLFTGVGVAIPYAMSHFKNARHSCMKCGRALAVQRFGGGTQAYLM